MTIAFCTSCSDTLNATIPAMGHSFANGNLKCSNCGYGITSDWSCKCHSGGLTSVLFKFLLVFQKLFRTNKACAFGVAHY